MQGNKKQWGGYVRRPVWVLMGDDQEGSQGKAGMETGRREVSWSGCREIKFSRLGLTYSIFSVSQAGRSEGA